MEWVTWGFDAITSSLWGISDNFQYFIEWLDGLVTYLLDLPTLIVDGIKDIFIPDTEEINSTFNAAINSIQSKFGFQEFNFNAITSNSAQPTDIQESYYIYGLGNMNLTFFDTKYLIKGVEFFRPFIRGFIVLLLVFYNIRQYLSFIGHDLGAVAYAEKSSKGEQFMIIETVFSWGCNFIVGLFSVFEIVHLPIDTISTLYTILCYGVWVVGADVLLLFTGSVMGWLVFKSSVGLVICL